MTIVASKVFTFTFVADGVSTTASFDLSQPPTEFNFSGRPPSGVISVTVTNTQSVSVPTVTPTLTGNVLALSFASAPAMNDAGSNRVIYTCNATVLF